jgi:forkhead box protein J2/3
MQASLVFPCKSLVASLNSSESAHSDRVPSSFDPSNPDYPLVSPSLQYPEGAEEGDLEQETDEHGNPHWRAIWLNELARLQQVTSAQDSAGADQEWYKMMVLRVRAAFFAPGPSAPYVEHPGVDQQPTEAVQAQEGTDPAMA